ncbi:hypothetical protein [Lysobacter enzymogenes]|uniref:hypothetical protein n=1 Tax=Lysobacter enzymogenes TaxID=69 RepID=UPI0019D00192|nr:hypothetical protein [Lysobacter enzymogenes]
MRCARTIEFVRLGLCSGGRIAHPRVAIDLVADAKSAGAMRANERNRTIRVVPVDAAQVHASRRRLSACAPIALCVAHWAMDAARSIRLV